MTRKQLIEKRGRILTELARMSRDWSRYTWQDWMPLETELEEIKRQLEK